MILALHQPYFFPYIGYFSLIASADVFMFFDNVQYICRSWMSRNRILKPGRNDVQYINIGLKKALFKTKLPDCNLLNNQQWKILVLKQLEHYKKVAPFYSDTMSILEEILKKNDTSLLEFNIRSTKTIISVLEITTPLELFSSIESKIKIADKPGLWGLHTCQARGASTYINAPGGETFYPKEAFKKAGVKLGFIQHKLSSYRQRNKEFIPGLSIIDVLMFNGVDKTSELINDYSVKWVSNKNG